MPPSARFSRVRFLVTASAALSIGLLARAFADTPSATFDHSTGQDQITTVSAQPGDSLRVTIQNTCPAWFSYAAQGATKTPLKPATLPTKTTTAVGHGLAAVPKGIKQSSLEELRKYFADQYCDMTSHDLFIVYDKQYGGYIITVSYKHPQAPRPTPPALSDANYQKALKEFVAGYKAEFTQEKCSSNPNCKNEMVAGIALAMVTKDYSGKAKTLRPIVETVVLSTPSSYVEFAGGVTLSQLTDPRFALATNPAGSGAPQVIVEDRQAEDSSKVGFAGFIHVHDPNCDGWACRHLAASLGFGITNDSKVSVFVGPSFRLAGKWFVTAGYNWGAIDRLPTGDHVGQPPQGSSDLSNLKSRTSRAFFFSFSYAFLNPGSSFFQKPFQSTPTVTQSSQGAKPTQ